VQQAAVFDGHSFDLLSLFEDDFGSAEMDIGRREIGKALAGVERMR
jgi:hypothetical protein